MAPEHPLVGELFPPGVRSPGAPIRALLDAALERVCACCRYASGPPGRVPFDELHAALRARADGVLALNCINLTCLLASALRAAGCPADDVFVAVGKLRGGVLPLEPIHAWLMLRASEGFLWVDPADPRPRPHAGRELLEVYSLFVVFNDRRACVLAADKRRLLLGEA